MKRTLFAALATALLLAPLAQGLATDHHQAAVDGADRLMYVQLDNGAMPWIVGDDRAFQNVQGVTAQGLLDAYKVTGDPAYLGDGDDGAEGVRNFLAQYMADNPDAFVSSGNLYFLAEYGLLTGDAEDVALAQEALERSIDDDRWEDTPEALAEAILTSRAANYDNLGLWDVALFVRGAQDAGNTTAADAFASVLVEQVNEQTIVDPFDETAANYEIGLAGLLFALAEADVVAHMDILNRAADALLATQAEDGSFGGDDVGEGDEQVTAYAALGLIEVARLPSAHAACDWLAQEQSTTGGWDVGSVEFAETDGEAVQALASCILPQHNGAVAYGNAVVPGL